MAGIDAFDRHAEEYDSWFTTHEIEFRAETALLGPLIPPGLRGLEIGAGSGIFARELGIKDGLEPSRTMAARARARGVHIIEGTAEHIPLAADCYDFALMVTTICFLDEPARALSEIYRVIRPGGFLLTGFVPSDSRLGVYYLDKKDRSRFYKEARFYSISEVQEMLRKAGFTRLETSDTLKSPDDPALPGGFAAVKGYKES